MIEAGKIQNPFNRAGKSIIKIRIKIEERKAPIA